jgi:hypothetical protein
MLVACDIVKADVGSAWRQPRRAVSTFEALVAFTLLASVLGMSVPLVVRHGRLLTSARQYRLAVEELTNQLEQLSALPPGDLVDAVEAAKISEFTAATLRGAELSGEVEPVELGQRVTLHIVWDEAQRRTAPLSMTAWVVGDVLPQDAPPQDAPSEVAADSDQGDAEEEQP